MGFNCSGEDRNGATGVYGRKDRLGYTKAVYHSLGRWYATYLSSDTGKLITSFFNQNVKEHARITEVK